MATETAIRSLVTRPIGRNFEHLFFGGRSSVSFSSERSSVRSSLPAKLGMLYRSRLYPDTP